MDKQCGNCKWWDVDHMETNDSLKFAKCEWAQNKKRTFFRLETPDLTPEQIEEFLNSAPASIGKHWLIKHPAPITEEQACEE